jgi:phosphoglycolate phosphatase
VLDVTERRTRGRQVVLFDLDGTLSNSEPGICTTLKVAIREVGLDVPSDAVLRTTIGPPFSTGLPAIGVPEQLVERVTVAYRAIYEETGLFDTCLYDGVVEMLDELGENGCTLCVATSKPETSARRVIEHLGLTDRFEVVGAAGDDYVRHTKADVIADVLDRLGDVADDEVVMVGDRRFDVEGATAHGIDTIGAGWGYGSAEELRSVGVWAIADHPVDVVAMMARRAGALRWSRA